MDELSSYLKMAAGLFLTIASISIVLVLFNSVKDATEHSQIIIQAALDSTATSASTPTDTSSSHSSSNNSGTKSEKESSKTNGMNPFIKALLFIVPALVIGVILGRLVFSYARTSDDTQIAAPWERRAEEANDQSNNQTPRAQRPVSVADALENMLANSSSVESVTSDSPRKSNRNTNTLEVSDPSSSGIRVIRQNTNDSSQHDDNEVDQPEVKRVIR